MTHYDKVKEQLYADPQTWLVTGCAGFIGSHLVENLLALGQHVVGLDNFATGKVGNLDEIQGLVSREQWANFTFVEGDLTRKADCERAVEGVAYVLHQGALGSVPRSIADPLPTHAANVDGFINMLDAARRSGTVKGFVYASSSSVYGDHPALPKVEGQIGSPLSPYALSKSINEQYSATYGRVYGFRSIGLRYFNVFGPRQDPEGPYAAVIPRWISAMLAGSDVEIYGDGETSRDFCYIRNVVQANILSAIAGDSLEKSEVLNIALGGRTTLNQLFELLQEGLASRIADYRRQKPTYKPFRDGDVRHSEANLEHSRQTIGYNATHSVYQGLGEAFDWYIKNN